MTENYIFVNQLLMGCFHITAITDYRAKGAIKTCLITFTEKAIYQIIAAKQTQTF
jgi:hypothetical protein